MQKVKALGPVNLEMAAAQEANKAMILEKVLERRENYRLMISWDWKETRLNLTAEYRKRLTLQCQMHRKSGKPSQMIRCLKQKSWRR